MKFGSHEDNIHGKHSLSWVPLQTKQLSLISTSFICFYYFFQIRLAIRRPVQASDKENVHKVKQRQTVNVTIFKNNDHLIPGSTCHCIHLHIVPLPSLLLIITHTHFRPSTVLLSKYSILTTTLLLPVSHTTAIATVQRMILNFFYYTDWLYFFTETAVNQSFKFSLEILQFQSGVLKLDSFQE